MSLSVDDYRRAVDLFRRHMERLGDHLLSIYLYGSVARGDVRPGESDLGDAYVFLRQETIENRESFLAALDCMVKACRNIARSGIPWHGFHYYGAEETRYIHAAFRPVILSAAESRRIAGEEMADRLQESVPIENGVHDMYHFFLFPMARFLTLEEPTLDERSDIVGRMDALRKFIPPWACAAAGAPASGEEALNALARICPDIDLTVFEKLAALRRKGKESLSSAELKALLLRCFDTVEKIHRSILARQNPWARAPQERMSG